MKRNAAAAIVGISLLGPLAAPLRAAEAPPVRKAVRARALLDVGTGRLVASPVILVEGERIQSVGPGLAIPPSGASVSVRPEDIAIADPASAPIRGRVTFVRDLGSIIEIFIDCAGTELIAAATRRERHDVQAGSEVGVAIAADHCVVLRS